MEGGFQKWWRSTGAKHFIDLLQLPCWLVSLEMLWGKLCLQREDCIDPILMSSYFKWLYDVLKNCYLGHISEHTHDVEGLLRDPADVHVTHSTGALLNFHWHSLLLQSKDWAKTVCHALVCIYGYCTSFKPCEKLLIYDISYRPWIQNLVNSKQHQDHQSTQEDVHEHPAWERSESITHWNKHMQRPTWEDNYLWEAVRRSVYWSLLYMMSVGDAHMARLCGEKVGPVRCGAGLKIWTCNTAFHSHLWRLVSHCSYLQMCESWTFICHWTAVRFKKQNNYHQSASTVWSFESNLFLASCSTSAAALPDGGGETFL